MKKLWGKYVIAYAMWVVSILLGILFLIVSRNSLGGLLEIYFVQGNYQRGKEAIFINQASFLVLGVVVLIFIIVVEEYFKNGARKDQLSRRVARVFGIELLFIVAANFANGVLIGFSTLVTLALVLELGLGVFLLWFGFKKIPKKVI